MYSVRGQNVEYSTLMTLSFIADKFILYNIFTIQQETVF